MIKANVTAVLLALAALSLPSLMLRWGDGWTETTLVFILYDHDTPGFEGLTSSYGVYTPFGIHGFIFGIVAPLCLLAAAVSSAEFRHAPKEFRSRVAAKAQEYEIDDGFPG